MFHFSVAIRATVGVAFMLACPTASAQRTSTQPQSAFSNQGETYEQDKIWSDRIKYGACSRIRDRRTDSQADIDECNRDNAMKPICVDYKGFAFAFYDIANNPPADQLNDPKTFGARVFALAMDTVDHFTREDDPAAPPYEHSPQFRDALRALVNVTFSRARTKWRTRDQFADYAYKICMAGHPFGPTDANPPSQTTMTPDVIRSGRNACVGAANAKFKRGADGPVASYAIWRTELKQCEDLLISRLTALQLKGWTDCSLKLDWMLRYRGMVYDFQQKEMAEDRYMEICAPK